MNAPLKLIYADACMVVIDKPAGMLVHRSNVDKYETVFALQSLREQLGQFVYPVHRFDKPTSGVLVFALNAEAASFLAQQFSERQVLKRYWLICRGHPQPSGTIDHALVPKDDFASAKRRRGVASPPKPALEARTDYTRLATATVDQCVDKYPQSHYSLVEAVPSTGRKHQLRRHFKHIAHPIIGDPKYGKSRHNRFFNDAYQCSRLLLHAKSICLRHPTRGQQITIEAPLSGVFADVVNRLFEQGGQR